MASLHRDPVTGRMSEVRRIRLAEHVYLQEQDPNALLMEAMARIADLERRGA